MTRFVFTDRQQTNIETSISWGYKTEKSVFFFCRKGHLANVEALLDAGANVDAVGMVRLYV
jgi:hypothetical protein